MHGGALRWVSRVALCMNHTVPDSGRMRLQRGHRKLGKRRWDEPLQRHLAVEGIEQPWYDMAADRTQWDALELSFAARVLRCGPTALQHRPAPDRYPFRDSKRSHARPCTEHDAHRTLSPCTYRYDRGPREDARTPPPKRWRAEVRSCLNLGRTPSLAQRLRRLFTTAHPCTSLAAEGLGIGLATSGRDAKAPEVLPANIAASERRQQASSSSRKPPGSAPLRQHEADGSPA